MQSYRAFPAFIVSGRQSLIPFSRADLIPSGDLTSQRFGKETETVAVGVQSPSTAGNSTKLH